MGVRVKPCSALTMRMVAVNAAVMLTVLLLFPTLSFVTEGLLTQSTDHAMPSLNREAKVRLQNRVYAIRFGSKSRLARAFIRADNVEGEEEITKANWQDTTSKWHHLRNVRARRLHAVMSDGKCYAVAVATTFRMRRMGPSNDPGRPIKLFIICANWGLGKVKKVGIRVALASPRGAPANQHVVPFGNNNRRRALKQLPQLQAPPVSFTLPSVLPISPPPSPQLRIPPFTGPSVPPLLSTPLLPQLRIPPLPFTGPATLPLVPPAPFLSVPTLPVTLPPALPLPVASVQPEQLNLPPLPPLPFQIPPLPCLPSSSGKSLPSP